MKAIPCNQRNGGHRKTLCPEPHRILLSITWEKVGSTLMAFQFFVTLKVCYRELVQVEEEGS